MSITSIRINDRGKYHDQKASFLLKNEIKDVENIKVKYGHNRKFLPVSVCYMSAPAGLVYVSAAVVGGMKDLTILESEWLTILKKLGSESLAYWKEIFNNRNKVAA